MPTEAIHNYTFQQVINAFSRAAANAEKDLWNLLSAANVAALIKGDNRESLYTGPQIDEMANLDEELREAIRAELAKMTPPPPPYARKYARKVLRVPWVSQMHPDDANDPYDCGPSCVLMLLRAAGKVGDEVTVEDLNEILFPEIVEKTEKDRRAWLKAKNDDGTPNGATGAGQLRQLALSKGLELATGVVNPALDNLYEAIDADRAVILGVQYRRLYVDPYEWDKHLDSGPDQGPHWLLVIGYEGDDFVVHDPLWPIDKDGGIAWLLEYDRLKGAASIPYEWSGYMVY